MNVEPTIGLALLAGFVSFISPCVLPLVPAYVGYMGGHATAAAENGRGKNFTTFFHGIFFVLGFTLFFVGFGLLTAAAASLLTDLGINIPTILTRLGGVAVILFGLYVMKALDPVFRVGLKLAEKLKSNQALAILFSIIIGLILLAYFYWVFEAILLAAAFLLLLLALFRKPLSQASSVGDFWGRAIHTLQMALVTDTRNLSMQRSRGYFGSLGMGIVFAAGWTPCIGPIYGSVLTLASEAAAEGKSLLPAGGLLTAYSLGLGVPFLITALALNQVSGLMRGLKRNMRKVEFVSGVLLILIGVLILSGTLAQLSRQFSAGGALGDLSIRLEACTAAAAEGRILVSSWGSCVSEGAPKLNDRIVFASQKTANPAANDSGLDVPTLGANPASDSSENTDRIFTVDPNFDPDSVPVGLEVGMRAPQFRTVTPQGKQVALSDFAGDVVLINFWATWCGPCGTEMPEFQRIYEEYSGRGFTILAVDFLEPPDQVQAFVDELGLTFPIGMDESGKINDLYRINQYPTSYVIDGHGVIVAKHAGPLSGDILLEVFKKLES